MSTPLPQPQSSTGLHTVADIRRIEQAAQATLPIGTLMERAGRAAAELARRLLPPDARPARVLVLAGPGNNGGDALEAAAHLAQPGKNIEVHIVLPLAARHPSAEAAAALKKARASLARFVPAAALPVLAGAGEWDLVIDGLFGIGLQRAMEEPFSSLVATVGSLPCPILALDVPSGLDADTGALAGGGGPVLRATHTITFIADKPGLHTAGGREYAGQITVDVLAITPALFPQARIRLNHPALFQDLLRPRQADSHKGSFGDALILGGARGMAGAVILAARAAARSGAGRVFAGFLEEAPAYDPPHPELMCRQASGLSLKRGALAIGPGLGTSGAAADLLRQALAAPLPLVLDADALNLLAADPALQAALRRRALPALLTPHPLEAARLLETETEAIQRDRMTAARQLAGRYRAHVVLKGAGSVLASPEGELLINPTGNAGLATAGSGDVLTGICAGLLAQHPEDLAAVARAAVWLHGAAADALLLQGQGPIGLSANELMPPLRTLLNRLSRQAPIRDY